MKDLKKIPKNLWLVNIACMLISVSAAMGFSAAPHFMREVLKLNMRDFGILDGFSEAMSQCSRLIIGLVIDYSQSKKKSMILGFVLAIISKPLLILANGFYLVAFSKVLERISNGIIAIPRDAYAVTEVDKKSKGMAVGTMMSMKTLGVSAGSFLVGITVWLMLDLKTILWLGVAVSISGLLCLIKIKDISAEKMENKKVDSLTKGQNNNFSLTKFFDINKLKQLSAQYWFIVAIFSICTCARFSDAFLMFRYTELGGSKAVSSSLIGIFNIVSVFCCLPIGMLSDKIGRTVLLMLVTAALIISHFCCFVATSPFMVLVGVVFWGIQRATIPVLFSALIADVVPKSVIGTSFGIQYLLSGVVLIFSGKFAGQLGDQSLHLTFLYGMVASIIGIILLIIYTIIFNKNSNNTDVHNKEQETFANKAA